MPTLPSPVLPQPASATASKTSDKQRRSNIYMTRLLHALIGSPSPVSSHCGESEASACINGNATPERDDRSFAGHLHNPPARRKTIRRNLDARNHGHRVVALPLTRSQNSFANISPK